MPNINRAAVVEANQDTTSQALIDLSAVRHNFRVIQEKIGPSRRVLAVVKANAYGLGVEPIAKALSMGGCRHFVVAFPGEGFELRALLPEAQIYVLSGAWPGQEATFATHGLIPVLNDADSVARWRLAAPQAPCAIHIDTGMARTGFEGRDFVHFAASIASLNVQCLMSHFANSDEETHPFNETQRALFASLCALLPGVPTCFANSCALTMGAPFWGDFVRPGLSLYGLAPPGAQEYGLRSALQVRGRIVQVRDIEPGQNVGYGLTWQAKRPSRIATVAMGYADGLPRPSSSKGAMWIEGHRVPIVGRVSMDFTTLDVTDLDPRMGRVGDWANLFYDGDTLNHQARMADAAPHEFLVGLGPRCVRIYEG